MMLPARGEQTWSAPGIRLEATNDGCKLRELRFPKSNNNVHFFDIKQQYVCTVFPHLESTLVIV